MYIPIIPNKKIINPDRLVCNYKNSNSFVHTQVKYINYHIISNRNVRPNIKAPVANTSFRV